jgi:phage-related protein
MKLADLLIQFSVANAEAVKTAVRGIEDQLRELQSSVNALGTLVADKFNDMVTAAKTTTAALAPLTTAFQGLANLINSGLKLATGTIGGLVTAGLAASAMGASLAFQMERLSLAVAGVFGPEIQKVIGLVAQFTDWLNSLSDAQKQSLAYWIEGAAAALAVATIFPKVIAATQAVIASVQALTVAIRSGLSATGIGALLPLLGLLLEGLTLLFVGTETGRGVLASLWEAFKPIADVVLAIGKAIGDILAPVFSVLGDLLQGLMAILEPFIKLLAFLAKVIINTVLLPFKLLAEAIKFISEGVKSLLGIEPKEKKKSRRGSLARRVGGLTGVGEIYNQVQQAAIQVSFGKTGTDRQIELSERQLAEQQKTNQILDSSPPVVKKGS